MHSCAIDELMVGKFVCSITLVKGRAIKRTQFSDNNLRVFQQFGAYIIVERRQVKFFCQSTSQFLHGGMITDHGLGESTHFWGCGNGQCQVGVSNIDVIRHQNYIGNLCVVKF